MIEQTVDVEIAISNWDPRYIYEEDVSRRYEIRATRNSTKFPVVSDRSKIHFSVQRGWFDRAAPVLRVSASDTGLL